MSKKDKIAVLVLTVWILIVLFLTSCATNMPNEYNRPVEITKGPYKGQTGILIGDCPGFENYLVKLVSDKFICIKPWNMKKVD